MYETCGMLLSILTSCTFSPLARNDSIQEVQKGTWWKEETYPYVHDGQWQTHVIKVTPNFALDDP